MFQKKKEKTKPATKRDSKFTFAICIVGNMNWICQWKYLPTQLSSSSGSIIAMRVCCCCPCCSPCCCCCCSCCCCCLSPAQITCWLTWNSVCHFHITNVIYCVNFVQIFSHNNNNKKNNNAEGDKATAAVQLEVYLILFGKAIKKKAASICMEFKPFQSRSRQMESFRCVCVFSDLWFAICVLGIWEFLKKLTLGTF